ncbi:MAG: ParA family protein [Rhodospirillales bacterium]
MAIFASSAAGAAAETGAAGPPPDPAVPSSAMQVIVCSAQKGGSGKTTLCGHLAVQAERAGAGPVALIDTDPQGSLAQWWNAREAESPVFMKAQVDYLHEDLRQLGRAGIRIVFIDTPPAVTEMIRRIVGFADLVIVPTKPSPHDLRAVGATLDIVEGLGKPLVFAVNDATPRARITGDTAVALSQHGTVAPVIVGHRTSFATSMIYGQTVMETEPDSAGAKEIAALWDYLASRLVRPEVRPTRPVGVFGASSVQGFGRRRTGKPEARPW